MRGRGMKNKAHAKINLCLNVKGKLENGYHEMEMVMVPLTLHDMIEINFSSEMALISNARFLTMDRRNTVIKAIELLREEYGFTQNFTITLNKHIPTQAGLAGGSSDAAATIRMLNKMLHLNMDENKMMEIAKKVGADVPFFIRSKPAVVEGIGEILTPFEVSADFQILLVKPRYGVSTKACFAKLNLQHAEHPNHLMMKKSLEDGDYQGVLEHLGNTLETPAIELVPEIATIKQILKDYGFDGVLMSGSGSTVFALTQNEELCTRALIDLREKGYFVKKTRIKD